MGFLSSSVLAFSISTDAFAVSLSKGAARRKKPLLKEALKIATIFGTVEALTPLLGWSTGLAASSFIKDIDHWIAFTILAFVGLKFIYESFSPEETKTTKQQSLWVTFLTAIATSIDAFAVGISLAFVEYNILLAALSMGLATFTMVTIGLMTGHMVGKKTGLYAERLGGACLILIGTKILLQHLGVL